MENRFNNYQIKLLFFLSIATFFDGFDFMAISQILPNLRNELMLTKAEGGIMMAFINLGAVAGYFLLKGADRYGRKKLLTITILGYTLFTFASGFAWNVYSFTVMQFFARLFLIAETSVAMVFVAEEFPAEKRGLALGIVQGSLSLGMIVCAALTPFLLERMYGWRNVYFVGIIPLALVAFARRNINETKRFSELYDDKKENKSFLYIWKTAHRKRLIQMSLIWFLTYLCVQSAVLFWKEFAVAERSFSDIQVGMSISIASLISMPFVFLTGKLLDTVGRRRGAAIIFGIEIIAVLGCYSFYSIGALTISLVLGVFGVSAVMVVLNSYTTELFPTNIRGSAFAWSNNLLGRIGYVASPLLVGALAEIWGWSISVISTLLPLTIALILILLLLPETKAKELEVTSQL